MLTEISLNVIDIAKNSTRAGANLICITIQINRSLHNLKLVITDNGKGMNVEQLKLVTDPFFTSRKTRNVGFGIPFLKQEAECTGGSFDIHSEQGKGTEVIAIFNTDNIDCMPLGDINSSIYTLVTSSGKEDYVYRYEVDGNGFELDTRKIKKIVGEISLQNIQVSSFIKSFLDENKAEVDRKDG